MDDSKEEIQLRPLGRLLNLIEASGFKAEHQYDDLVFVNNTAFLFRFDEEITDKVHLHFNAECEPDAKKNLTELMLERSKEENVFLVVSGDFKLRQPDKDKEEFQIVFS